MLTLTILVTKTMNERETELMHHLWNTEYGNISVGERRWLLITSLCEIKRKLYIFDEPTSGVDPDSRIHIFRRLELLSTQEDTYVLLSSHNLHELQYIQYKLYLLHQGKIAFQGSYQEFLDQAGTDHPDLAFREYVVAASESDVRLK